MTHAWHESMRGIKTSILSVGLRGPFLLCHTVCDAEYSIRSTLIFPRLRIYTLAANQFQDRALGGSIRTCLSDKRHNSPPYRPSLDWLIKCCLVLILVPLYHPEIAALSLNPL